MEEEEVKKLVERVYYADFVMASGILMMLLILISLFIGDMEIVKILSILHLLCASTYILFIAEKNY